MRQLFLAGVVFTVGCQGVVGPAQRYCLPKGPIDDPCLTPSEQNERVRDRIPWPEAANAYGPRTYADNPALKGP